MSAPREVGENKSYRGQLLRILFSRCLVILRACNIPSIVPCVLHEHKKSRLWSRPPSVKIPARGVEGAGGGHGAMAEAFRRYLGDELL